MCQDRPAQTPWCVGIPQPSPRLLWPRPRVFAPHGDPSEVQYYSSGRDCCVSGFSHAAADVGRGEGTRRVTANDSAAYSRANRAIAAKAAVRSTRVARKNCAVSSILPDTAQARINKGWKHMIPSTIVKNCASSDRASAGVTRRQA